MLKSPSHSLTTTALGVLAAAGYIGSAVAGEHPAPPPVTEAKEPSIYDRIWGSLVLYKNERSAFLNEFRLVGRSQFDAYIISSDQGNDNDWIVRRTRLGAKALMFQKLTFHTEVDFNLQDPRPLYTRLTDAYLEWEFCKAAVLTVGKQGAAFTLDGATSSKSLLTIDRSNLANNLWFPTEYFSGVNLAGEIGEFQYNTGFYSRSGQPEFGDFNVGNFWLGSVGYDFGKMLGIKKALVRADYVYNDPENYPNNGTRQFNQVGALVVQVENGRWGVWGDVAAGQGYGSQSDVFGVNVMPFFNITEKFQAVLRYTYLSSEDPNGVRLARYDTAVTSERGDEYNEIYAGLNYFFYGQKLKIQTGVSYVNLADSGTSQADYHSWQWTTGLRISF